MNEFDIIRRFFTSPTQASGVDVGIGDDAALLTLPANTQLVVATDTLVAGRHFAHDCPPHAIGFKAAAVNLSDMAAMGGAPHSMLLALSLPVHLAQNEAWLAQFSQGLFAANAPFTVALVGGDTTRSDTLSMSITVMGFVPQGRAILRSGAQVGDALVVSGTLGDAAYALATPHSALQARLDYPSARVALGLALRGLASSMLDVSDGLVQDVSHILQASRVSASIDVALLPLSATLLALPLAQRLQYALAGGDDYELCFTVPAKQVANLPELAAQLGVPLTVIGRIMPKVAEKPHIQWLNANKPYTLATDINLQGYQHFA